MAGGLMQLVAYGAQDVYITGKAQVTFFKILYRRHTNFAIESIEQTINGAQQWGKRASFTLARSGDLANRIVAEIGLPAVEGSLSGMVSFKWIDNLGYYIFDTVILEIGGQEIDRQHGDWMAMWSSFSTPAGLEDTHNEMIGNFPMFDHSGHSLETESALNVYFAGDRAATTLYVPLHFFFCRHLGLSLPLIALQYHEVKIIYTLAAASTLLQSVDNALSAPDLVSISFWVDYVYTDTDERRRMAQVSHEYLIEQVQTNEAPFSGANAQITLNLNHPCKALFWYLQNDFFRANNQHANWTDTMAEELLDEMYCVKPVGSSNPLKDGTVVLQLNGQDRFAARGGRVFNLVQAYFNMDGGFKSPGAMAYNFGFKVVEHQPHGACNFSRIDNAKLIFKGISWQHSTDFPSSNVTGTIRVFAVNYNVLRVMSGMAGLAYSN